MDGGKLESIWNKQFVHILLIECCLQFGIYTVSPIVSNYAVVLGASVGVAGFVAGLNAIFSLVLRPFMGWITDNLAKRFLLVLCGLLFVCSGFGCAFAPSLEFVGFFRAMQGAAFAFKSVILLGFASFVVPKEKMGSATGWFAIGSTVASAVAPTVGTTIGVKLGYNASFVAAGCFFLLGLILILILKVPEEVLEAESKRARTRATMNVDGKRPKLDAKAFFYLPALVPSLLGGLTSCCFAIISAFLIMISAERGIEGAYLYFLVYSVFGFFSKPVAGALLDKHGFAKVFPPSLLIMVAAPMILAFSDSISWVLIAGAVFGVGHASAYASASASAVKMSRDNPEISGRVINTFYVFPDIGMGLGPLAGGLVYQSFGAEAMFIFVACIGLLDLLFALGLKSLKKI